MVVDNILHMNAGNGETSYANNSYFQKNLLMKAKPMVEDAIKGLFKSGAVPSCVKIADLGCSSGLNTFLAITGIISTIHDVCQKEKQRSPEFQVYLNDLPGNDFNTIFKLTPAFYEGIKREKGDELGRIFVSGVPGSFYGRLFPSNSLNFAHSTTSLHWLSHVPDGIEDNKGCIYMSKKSPPHVLTAYAKQFERDFSTFLSVRGEEIVPGGRMVLEFFGRSSADPTCIDCYLHWQKLADSLVEMAAEVPDGIEDNKGCIYMSKKSPPHVLTAYAKQFERDFSTFLSVRGEEIVPGGRMVLEFFGRSSADPTCIDCYLHWQKLADSLVEMAAEGLVNEADVDSFNVPHYTPFWEEARKIIEEEGSFNIEKLEPIEVSADPMFDKEDKTKSGQMVAESLRAVLEPMFTSYFGSTIIDDLFQRFGKRMAKHLSMTKGRLVILGISLSKK